MSTAATPSARPHINAARLLRAIERPIDPVEHEGGRLTVADFILGILPRAEDPAGVVASAARACRRLDSLHRQVLGRLALIADKVEKACGYPPVRSAGEVVTEAMHSPDTRRR